MKPVCVRCQRFYRPKHTGVSFEEAMPARPYAPPGTADPEAWQAYKLWNGDLWECEGCGSQIISGFGHAPLAEHYQPDYADKVKRFAPICRVNDC